MQRNEHHTLIYTYLDIFRSWEKNKSYSTELDVKKKETTNVRDKINSCQMIQTRHKKSCHAQFLQLRERSAAGLHMMEKKRKMEDKEADLLCHALLRGISYFDSK